MISVFYSTKKENKAHYNHLKKSSKFKDIEIIEFINSGETSLAKAYNQALEQSKFDILVCVHDDVFLDKGWDKKIYDYFQTSTYGILGVAGSTTLDESGVWWHNQQEMCGLVSHQTPEGHWYESPYSFPHKKTILPTVNVDGVFIAIHKKRIKEKFDERFDGFHFYDIPFCVSNFVSDVEIGVVCDLGIKHKSIGQVNQVWSDNREKFADLYSEHLPLNITPPIKHTQRKVKLGKIKPKVSIIILSKNNFEYLERCVKSLKKTAYSNYEIIVADTGSDKECLEKTNSLRVKTLEYDYYHFARINNDVVKNHLSSDTSLLLFCNDDIMMFNDAISMMVQHFQRNKRGVGTVGCRLYYGDNRIQHGGIKALMNSKGQVGLTHEGLKTFYGASFKSQRVLGNTGAFMMLRRDIFNLLGGFDENTKDCMEDVLLNIKCISRNLKNTYIGEAVCYHYESVTRSKNPQKAQMEQDDLLNRVIPAIKKNFKKLRPYITMLK